jgi:hypothetical protein
MDLAWSNHRQCDPTRDPLRLRSGQAFTWLNCAGFGMTPSDVMVSFTLSRLLQSSKCRSPFKLKKPVARRAPAAS